MSKTTDRWNRECQPDYDNDNIRIERSHLHGHMEDGLRDHGITARSRGSGARYFSRVSPFAGQPTVDGGDDADQPFGVEGDDSTLGVFLAVSPLTSQLTRTRFRNGGIVNNTMIQQWHRDTVFDDT